MIGMMFESAMYPENSPEYRELEPVVRREVALLIADRSDTLCWACNQPYPMFAPACPKCGSANGNVDINAAIKQGNDRA